MRRRQSIRDRPNLQTANAWLKEGHFEISEKHWLSDEERAAEIKKVCDELQDFAHKFPKTQNLEYAILKFHLIMELAITQYIRCHSAAYVSIKEIRFTFSQKLEIAFLMGFGIHEPTLLPTVELLNKARNQVAHTFSLERKTVDEILRINGGDAEHFHVGNDRQRISGLRNICRWICGYTSGCIEGEYYATRFIEDDALAHWNARSSPQR